ncbi:Glucosyltransferase MdoH [Sulfitobacter noctilucicola]|nr:hypothetical protein [Sulfitobacter noctilucicola]KIN63672.1 Glucosyltransferase MdoH [Sulfitobacter noctilucicola]
MAGIALMGAGLLMRAWRPSALSLPDRPEKDRHTDRGVAKAARRSRDGVATILPRNMTGSLGRSLLIMGAGLVMVRVLDEFVEDEEALF